MTASSFFEGPIGLALTAVSGAMVSNRLLFPLPYDPTLSAVSLAHHAVYIHINIRAFAHDTSALLRLFAH
jgi:hypothetical protein